MKMKFKIVIRILSFTLASALLVGMAASVPASAADAAGADTQSENSDDISIGGLKVSRDTLEKLAETTDIPGLSFGMSLLFDNVWSESGSNPYVQHIDEELNAISDQIRDIDGEMKNLARNVKNESERTILQNRIDAYTDYSYDFETKMIDYMDTMEEIDGLSDKAEKAKRQKQFLKDIYYAQIKGEDFCSAMESLGHKLVASTDPYRSDVRHSDDDLLNTFDELARYTYPWEHQGYATRRRFQASVLGLYSCLASFAELSLAEAIQDNLPVNCSGASPKSQFKQLRDVTKNLAALAKRNEVKERQYNLRYYQVPGNECLLFWTAELKTVHSLPKDHGSYDEFNQAVLKTYDDLFTNGNFGMKYSLPSADWLKQVYMDYGGEKSLWNIFFGKTEGNISALKNYDDSTYRFLTDDHKIERAVVLGYGYTIHGTIVDLDATVSKNLLLSWMAMAPASKDWKKDSKWFNLDVDDNDQYWMIDLIVLKYGETPADYVPEATNPTATKQSSSSSGSAGASSQSVKVSSSSGSASSAAASNPNTGGTGVGVVCIPALLLSALAILRFRKKRPRASR